MPTEQLRQHSESLTDVDLAARLNRLLRDGQVQLDFNGVREVSADFARALLDGLDLGRAGENLGAETMSPEVAAAFERQGTPAEAPAEVEAPVVVGQDVLNPITALGETVRSYRDYLVTEFRARDDALRRRLEEALARPAFLAQEPYFSTHIPFK